MLTKKSSLSFSETNLFSPIILDFIKSDSKLLSLIDCFPNIDSIKNKLKKINFEHREVLVNTVRQQYNNTSFLAGRSKDVDDNINLLLDSKTFTICTGHQLNIFISPLFLIYKITSIIAYANYLDEHIPNHKFVPCFWMATEDHDFKEINELSIYNKKYSWNLQTKNAVGDLSTHSIKELLNNLEKVLDHSKYGRDLYNIYYHAYTANSNYADATRSIIDSLFGDYGLVVVDGNCMAQKQLFSNDMKEEITTNYIFKNIHDSNLSMRSNYKPQINALKSNLFYLHNNIRSKILYNNNVYKSSCHNKEWTKIELLNEIENYPNRFSPNVFMRTLYQQSILPNALYLGGPSEIAYWLQLYSLFNSRNKFFPVLDLRSFFIILSKSILSFYKKHNLNDADIFIDYHLKIKKIIKNISNHDDLKLKKNINDLLEIIEKKINKIHNFPLNSFRVFEKRVHNSLLQLETKIIKFEKNNNKNILDQLSSIEQKIFTNNDPQEKSYSFIPYFIKYGPAFFNLLIEESLIFDNKYIILKENS